MFSKTLRTLAFASAAAALTVFGSDEAKAAAIDLGFALDESGSVSLSDYNLAKQGLAAALGQIPTSGPNQYRVSVIAFASVPRTIVAPTVVDAGNLAGIQSAVSGDTKQGGGTNIASAVTSLTNLFLNTGGLGDTSLLNVTTDGQSSIPALQTAATSAASSGIDGLSFEAVGFGADVAGLASVAFPTPSQIVPSGGTLPNPLQAGFVFEVENFDDYESAIASKIGRIIIDTGGDPTGDPDGFIPVPAALPLLLSGFGAMGFLGWRRRSAA